MRISKGMYIRTEYGISRIVEFRERKNNLSCYYLDKNIMGEEKYLSNCIYDYKYYTDQILKASFNLIDLIEFGDIVKTPKGKFEVGYVDNNVIYTLDSKIIACLRTDEHLCFENKIINSIITKEQFNSMKYVVERDK